MSKVRGLAFVVAFGVAVAAQASTTLFGLRNPGDGGRQLVTIDAATAAVTEVSGSIDPPNGTSSGVVALDAAGERFFFAGTPGTEVVQRIYMVHTPTGIVLASPTIDIGTTLLGLEYDGDEDKLFALRTVFDAGKQVILLDPVTGGAGPISVSIDPPLSMPSGVTALDSAGNRFFFVGTPGLETGQRIYSVDTNTGAVLGSPEIAGGGVLHLEYDDAEDVLYAVRNPGDAGKQLVSIDTATGAVTAISASFDAPLAVQSGVNALDAAGNEFYFIGTRTGETDSRLYSINTATGALTSAPVIAESAVKFFSGIVFAFSSDPPPPPPTGDAAIDIRPNGPNQININGNGSVPVAILTTPDFDAAMVDVSTVRFGPANAPVWGNTQFKDVDKDGDTDLLVHFRARDTGIACGATSATLTGETMGGQPFSGSDSVNVLGCK